MGRCRDLTLAELNTGTIRSPLPRHVIPHPRRPQLPKDGKYCPDCNKQGFYSEEAARERIAELVCTGNLIEKNAFAVRPYICPHGWWHFGRDYNVVKMLTERIRIRHKAKFTDPATTAQITA